MRLLLAFAAILLTATQAFTANVDEATARAQAQRFLNTMSAPGRMAAPAQGDLKIAHIERNTANPAVPVYYIFNTEKSFVIVWRCSTGTVLSRGGFSFPSCMISSLNRPTICAWCG